MFGMKKIIVLILVISIKFSAVADEGMWFLMHLKRLNERDMQKMGLQLTAEEIYTSTIPASKMPSYSLAADALPRSSLVKAWC